jgi:hypothetical protein
MTERDFPYRTVTLCLVVTVACLLWSVVTLRRKNAALAQAAHVSEMTAEKLKLSYAPLVSQPKVLESKARGPSTLGETAQPTKMPSQHTDGFAPRTEGLEQLERESATAREQLSALERELFTMAKELRITPDVLDHPETSPEEYRTFFRTMQAWQAELDRATTMDMRIRAEIADLGVGSHSDENSGVIIEPPK